MEEAVQELNTYLANENRRLQELADVLQEKHRTMSQEVQGDGRRVPWVRQLQGCFGVRHKQAQEHVRGFVNGAKKLLGRVPCACRSKAEHVKFATVGRDPMDC